MLKIDNLSAGYGDMQVLYDISLHVDEGEVVSIIGSNGAGKTTLLKILSGFVPIKAGTVLYQGEDLLKQKPRKRAEMGIAHIPQGRGILGTLTVKENLIMGAYPKAYRHTAEEGMERAFQLFPILGERQNQMAGSLSGGQQQMLAISRSLMIQPKLLLLDEPSLGLAPIVVEEMFELIAKVAEDNMSILIVEQNLHQALGVANRAYVIETGKVVLEGNSKELLANEDIQRAYLGV
ncbi:MAG: ABC transporter ATP-binding protein [Lachnospiraceae bacterium]|nr:ABC transporter ATP-binding protein [Lachnospiraceae bacterium]